MKKFIVAFLGLFMMLGASILYACGPTKIELNLSTQSVSLQLNGEEVDRSTAITVDITGTDDQSVSLDFVYDDDIASATLSQNSEGQNVITITAHNEGNTELVVMTKQGSVKKTVSIEVYNEVTSMAEKTEEIEVGGKSSRYLVKNGTFQMLEQDKLLSFTPSTSTRKNVNWTFEANGTTEYDGAIISGNQIFVPDTFAGDEIVLRATSANNSDVFTTVTLPCIEQINVSNIRIGASIYETSGFDFTTTTEGTALGEVSVEITPNISQYLGSETDRPFENAAYIMVETTLAEGFELIPMVTDVYGNQTDLLEVVSDSKTSNRYIYRVFAKSNTSVNQNFYVSFKVGYSDYDYSIDISSAFADVGEEYGRITVEAAEKIKKISVYKNSADATLNTQTLYSQYSNYLNSGYGQLFKVSLTPDTVLWAEDNQPASGNYIITVQAFDESEVIPVQAFYRSNGVYMPISFTLQDEQWISEEISSTSSKTFEHSLYLKANPEYFEANNLTSKEGITLTFSSVDNSRATKAVINAKIVQTSNEISISGSDETGETVSEIILNSTTAVSTPFYFILHGQTTVDGLSISSNSQYVDISEPKFISLSNDGENVRFAVDVTLKENYVGLTNNSSSFTIVHENGMQSQPITLNIYFPLTDASVTANNTSASIVLNDNRNYIVENGAVNLNGSLSAGILMLKNGTTTPLMHSFNKSSNGNMAEASVSVGFYDYVEGEISLEEYLSLFANNNGDLEENLNTIIERAEEQNTASAIVAFDSFANDAIRTKKAGYTYIVFTYEGIGIGGGDATFKRIVLVHSYSAVESFAITPSSDRNFSLYASDSVGETGGEIKKTIRVSYSSSDITYRDSDNFEFRTVFGKETYTGRFDPYTHQVVWNGYEANKSPVDAYYQILNVNPQATYIEFTIYALSTNGVQNSPQILYLDYHLTSEDASLNLAGLTGSTSPYQAVLSFTLINADRVEEVTIDGIDDEGIYFEIGSLTSTSQYVIVQTSPDSARNTGVSYIVVNENGDQTTSIVDVMPIASVSTRLKIDLSKTITEGTSGTLYVFPTDAVNNGIINYQFTDKAGQVQSGKIMLSDLGRTRSDGLTYFEYLTQNAFFTNNQGEQISFANIFKEVSIQVADGKSFEHAYRVYDKSGFDKGASSSTYFYAVMNDITLKSTTTSSLFADFTGGVEGYNGNSDITITLTGYNFAGTLSRSGSEGGQIRNISFNGQVTGSGFVVNTNSGTITNVTIDTEGIYSSVLTGDSGLVGGIVGTNKGDGTIENVSVLGLTILAPEATVGGVAGENRGKISIARVEFYNLAQQSTESDTETPNDLQTQYNSFSGATVGGVVGKQTGSSISQVYVYDYNLSSHSSLSRLKGSSVVGALVGSYAATTGLTITESFALVDNIDSLEKLVGQSNVNVQTTFTRSYIAYYNESDTYTVVYSNATDGNNGDFSSNGERVITSADPNFNSNINNGNAYLRYFYQDEKVTNVNGQFNTVLNGDLYSAISIEDKDTKEKSIIFFRNNVNVGSSSLTSSQAQDYRELNTISISSLLANYSDNMIVSSNSSSLVVSGSEIFIQSIGSGSLSIYSKQDVSINTTMEYVVDKALSRMVVTSESATGKVEEFTHEQETTVNLQKSKSKLFVASFATTSVYLGSGADEFALDMLSSFDITTASDPTSKVTFTQISNTTFNALSNGDTALTASIYPVLSSGAEAYQSAVTEETKVNITIKPVDGAIAIGYDGDEISMSPSTIANVNVSMQTTDKDDTIAPQIVLVANGVETALSMKSDTTNTFTFSKQDGTAVFTVTRTDNSESQSDPTTIYTKEFAFRFEVAEDYKRKLSLNEVYKVSFVSDSQFTSESLTINLARQGISKADVTNYKVDIASYNYNSGINSGITTYTTLSTSTGVMAPGSSSIMHASVNPEYAYYDYMEVTVTGSSIASPVVFIPVEKTSDNLKYQTTDDVTFESLPNKNGFRFTPKLFYSAGEYGGDDPKYNLHFHATFSRAIPEDCTLTITLTYYVYNSETGESEVVDHVNSFIFVSYLAEPTITIDGDTSTLLAKGGSAEVEIAVNLDQEVEAINISEARRGIEYDFLDEEIDQTNNRRIYRYNLSATILAESMNDDNRIYVNATVVRRINNNVERKTTTATVTLVDFKINPDATYVEGAENGTLKVYANINQTISLNYVFDPEDPYYDNSNQAAIDAYNDIISKRNTFEKNHTYPALNVNGSLVEGYTSDYLINVQETEGIDQNPTYKAIPLIDRMYYVVGNQLVPVMGADSENSLFEISVDSRGKINIRAKTLTEATQQMMIRTYVVTNGESRIIEKYFNIQVSPWTSEDLPTMINTAQEFLSLAQSEGSGMYDYILMNDIVLENYVPFNTDFIASLDGNGFTIHIKSFDTTASSSTLNLALFDTVNANTTLKNVRVNLYNGGQINVKVGSGNITDLNVAGFAITNNGIITNCEVVSFYTDQYAIGQSGLNETATNKIAGEHGINIKYMNGSNEVSMSENSSWDSQVAGFVINNNGNITNSRVGGDDIIELLEVDPTYNNQITARVTALDNFNIVAQGQTSGFVLQNQGSISASFAKNLAIQNDSRTARENKAFATGFVGTNSGKILTSYVEGVKQTSSDSDKVYARMGSLISTEQAVIAGFVLTNSGDSSLIENSYSNIMISNADTQEGVYLASGFVYRNEGKVVNCYSASQIENQRYLQMSFSGLDAAGNLLASGEYENCYYYNTDYRSTDATTGSGTESDFNTNVIMLPTPDREEYYYGFSIATYGGEDGIWAMDTNTVGGEGLKLLEPDDIAISYRYVNYLEYNADGSVNTDGEYQLPYGIIYVAEGTSEYEIDARYGTDENPIIIRNAQEFIDITGASESTPIQEQFKDTIHGTYRLVSDIDMSAFSSQVMSLPSTQSAFSGKFYGNGFTISGLSLSYNGNNLAYGLFKSIEPYNDGLRTYYPRVVGLNIQTNSNMLASDTTFVGTLAGYIKDAMIVNVEITYSNGAMVQGRNFVGALAGLVSGDSIVKNITITNPNVQAVRMTTTIDTTTFEVNDINNFRNSVLSSLNYTYMFTGSDSISSITSPYSYAGGIVGYMDIYSIVQTYFTYTTIPTFNVTAIRALGTINVTGQVAGGLFGLTAHQTYIEDAGVTVAGRMEDNTSHILSTKDYAGGVIGQSFGYLSKIFSEHEEEVQQDIEDNIASYYAGNTSVERGILNLFMAENQSSTNYYQKAIGGLIGFVGSGVLQTSYSKLNVISLSAENAGGLVGEIKLTGARSYRYQTSAGEGFTKFLFHETFASGDVRAYKEGSEGKSGGLIGCISDSSDRVSLLSTNAINFFTNIDYRTGKAYSSASFGDRTTVSDTPGYMAKFVYQVLGGVGENIDISDIPTVLTIASAKNVATAEKGKSLGYVQYYRFNGEETLIFINLYNGYDFELYATDDTQPVEAIDTYTNGSIGFQATQKVFLNSSVWDTNNWVHNSDKIFPEIKYSIGQLATVYLDDYNKAEILQMMTENKNLNVILRGLKTANGTEYVDVDISALQEIYQLSNFSGRISGLADKEYWTDQTGQTGASKDRQVRLIINSSLFGSTSAGFSMDNVNIQFGGGEAGNDDALGVEGGIISSSTLNTVTLKNITLFIKNPVTVNAVNVSNSDGAAAGLIAPSIDGTVITDFTFDLTEMTTTLTSDTTIMSVGVAGHATSKIHAGWIAGRANQTSNTTKMLVNNVGIEIKAGEENKAFTALGFSASSSANAVNAGLIFGSVAKLDAESLIRVAEFHTSFTMPSGKEITINASNLTVSDASNIGGFIGLVEGLDKLTLLGENGTTNTFTLKAPKINSSNKDLNVGGMIGSVVGNSGNTDISTAQSGNTGSDNFSMTLHVIITPNNESSANANYYYGGVAGQSQQALPISRTTVELTVDVADSQNTYIGGAVGYLKSSEETKIADLKSTVTVNSSTDEDNPITIGSTQIGGVIGNLQSSASTTISDLTSTVTVNGSDDANNPIEIGKTKIGGVVGYVGGTGVTIGASSARNINSTLIVVGNIKSTSTQVGGVIGQADASVGIYGTEAYLAIADEFKPSGGNESGLLGSVNYGGVVGSANSARVTLANIYVKDATVDADGKGIAEVDQGINLTTSASTPVAIGSMVGYSTHIISAVNGQLYSDLTIDSTSTGSGSGALYIGGLVGYNYQVGFTSTDDGVTTLGTDASIAYTGTITVDLGDARGASVGGIMGYLQGDSSSDPTITNSIFGGKIIIKEQNGQAVIVGGTIANANSNFTVASANNYGDVFIDYSEKPTSETPQNASSRMSSYKFGGIVGQINSDGKLGTIKNSNSMVTNYNARLAGTTADTTKSDQTGAIVGAGTLSATTSNYYNSAVSLAYDNQGTDIGYNASSANGYKVATGSAYVAESIIARIKAKIDANLLAFIGNGAEEFDIDSYATAGTKLNPAETWTAPSTQTEGASKEAGTGTDGEGAGTGSDDKPVSNGTGHTVKYFTSDAFASVQGQTLTNVAIVGDFEDATLTKPIQSIDGYSSISGVNFKIEYNGNIEGYATSEHIGGVVNVMSGGSILYGVGVNGTMSIGISNKTNNIARSFFMGGIVGSMRSGLIAESYTSLDMIYRGKAHDTGSGPAVATAIANHYAGSNDTGDNQLAFIEYTYATGSVVSYIDAELIGFANSIVNTNDNKSNMMISDCYTITKLDQNDYTSTDAPEADIYANKGGTVEDLYYDKNGLNVTLSAGESTGGSLLYTNFLSNAESNSSYATEDWSRAVNFNYGYPTRGFTYLKQSSWSATAVPSHTETGDSGYDSYVESRTYTRTANGSSSNSGTFLVPNIGVLQYILNSTTGSDWAEIKSMALMYDVDLSKTEFSDGKFDNGAETAIKLSLGSKKLDGQDHTIIGLRDSLFSSITGGVVRNLRLTEAEVNNESQADAFGLLAKTMSGGLVSNMTLEGEVNITSTASTDVGGLIGQIEAGEINTITNLLKVTYSNSSGTSIGGIVGHIETTANSNSDVSILYCSNYGPITGKSFARSVGGIVGSFDQVRGGAKTIINYCFNGSSVLAGYTNSDTTYNSTPYYAGGIVGFIPASTNGDIDISNCYNAGIIKAGHKDHANGAEADATQAIAYASGIVGSAAGNPVSATEGIGVYISNCYNEGSIEALGVDPTTEYVVTGVTYVNGLVSDAEGSKIYLVQTNAKNVSGYHIADIAVTDCAKSDDADLELDGAMLEQYSGGKLADTAPTDATVYGSGDYLCMYDKDAENGYVSVNSDEPGQQIFGSGVQNVNTGSGFTPVTDANWEVKVVLNRYYIGKKFNAHAIEIELKSMQSNDFKDNNDDSSTSDFSALQFNKLKIPTYFVETQKIEVKIYIGAWMNQLAGEGPQNLSNGPTSTQTINRNYYYDFSDQISGEESGKEGIITTMENALGASGSTLKEDLQLDKSSFGANPNSGVNKNTEVTIGGDPYILAYNYSPVFESGTYTYTWEKEIALSELGVKDESAIDDDCWSYNVTISYTENEDPIGATSTNEGDSGVRMSVIPSAGSRTFSFTYSGVSLGDDPKLSGSIYYNKAFELDLTGSTSDFIYHDDTSFAIDVTGIFNISIDGGSSTSTNVSDLASLVMPDVELTDANGAKHDKVICFTAEDTGTNYYFVLNTETANKPIIEYYTNATVTGVEGKVNIKGEDKTLLSIVENFPLQLSSIVNYSIGLASVDLSEDNYASFESMADSKALERSGQLSFTEEDENENSVIVRDPYRCGSSLSALKESGYIADYSDDVVTDESGNYVLAIEFNSSFKRLMIYADALSGGTYLFAMYNSGADSLAAEDIWIDNLVDDVTVEFKDNTLTFKSPSSHRHQIAYLRYATYLAKFNDDQWTNSLENINATTFKFQQSEFPFADKPSETKEGITVEYNKTVDDSDVTFTAENVLKANIAYLLDGVAGTAKATYNVKKITNGRDKTIFYKADGTFKMLAAGESEEGNWSNVEILEYYSGTTNRPIKAGDEVTIEYDHSENTVDGTTTYSYKIASFNVVQNGDSYSLVYKEGYFYSGSYSENNEDEGTENSTALTDAQKTAISGAMQIYKDSNNVLYIYSNNGNINLYNIARSTTVNDTLTINGIARGAPSTHTFTLSGIDLSEQNQAYNLDTTTGVLSTYFNNVTDDDEDIFNLKETKTLPFGEISYSGYTPPSENVSTIILMNDIFVVPTNQNIVLGFNIYGNHHALISNQEGSMFSALGKSAGEGEGEGVRLENLDIVGTTSRKIFNALNGTNEFYNIDFYGTVYNKIEIEAEESEADGEADDGNTGSKDTIGLDGIFGTHVDIYTAIYGKEDVKISVANMDESSQPSSTPTVQDEGSGGESQPATDDPNTHVKLKGVVFAADGEDGTSGTSATAGGDGKSITLTNTINDMLIAVKAGDAGNGGLTLSSGLPSGTDDVKAGGAAGTVTGANETFSSEAGISGGVYRSDETGNSDTTFKQRAIGAVHTCTDGDGNHVKFGWNNGDRTAEPAENSDENATPEVAILIESPRSTEFSLAGVGSNFAAYYQHGADDPPSAKELLSTGGRGDFVNSADGEHLGKEAFKYLVLDAAGNSVYSKSSFIAAE